MRLDYLYFDSFTFRSFLYAMRYALILGVLIIISFCYFQYFKKKEIRYANVSLKVGFPTYLKNKQFYYILSIIDSGLNFNIDNEILYNNFLDLFDNDSNIDSFFLKNNIFKKALKNTQISSIEEISCLIKRDVSWIEEHILSCSFTFLELEKGFVEKLPIQELFIMYIDHINKKNIEKFKQSVFNFLELKKNIIREQVEQLSKYRKDKQLGWLHESLEKRSAELLSSYLPDKKIITLLDFTTFSVIDSATYNSVHRSWFSSMLYVTLLILGFYFVLLYILYLLYSKK